MTGKEVYKRLLDGNKQVQIYVIERAKALEVLECSNTVIAGFNPTRDMDVRISTTLYVVLCVDDVLGRSPVQGSYYMSKEFTFSEFILNRNRLE